MTGRVGEGGRRDPPISDLHLPLIGLSGDTTSPPPTLFPSATLSHTLLAPLSSRVHLTCQSLAQPVSHPQTGPAPCTPAWVAWWPLQRDSGAM